MKRDGFETGNRPHVSQREKEAHEKQDKEWVRKMRAKDMDPETIADLMSLSVETVNAWLAE